MKNRIKYKCGYFYYTILAASRFCFVFILPFMTFQPDDLRDSQIFMYIIQSGVLIVFPPLDIVLPLPFGAENNKVR